MISDIKNYKFSILLYFIRTFKKYSTCRPLTMTQVFSQL